MTDVDVLVVGGGPAGSSTALHLVRKEGIRPERIVVLDKARFPREKPCAGAVSQAGVDALLSIGVSIRVPSIVMEGARILYRDRIGESVIPMGIVARRIELDAQLLDDARADGVVVRDGVGLSALRRDGSETVITTTEGDTIRTRLVAACDGAGSTTRKLLGIREPERKGHLYVLETETNTEDSGVTRGLVDFDLGVFEDGLQGYYWDFPTPIGGTTHVSRGIYHANIDPRGDVKTVLGRFLARRGVDIAKVKLKPFSTRPFVRGSTTWVRGVVLVGEAAGIDRTTGEGIAQAIVMAEIAARHLAIALREKRDTFYRYASEVFSSTVGRHFLQSAWLARRVYSRRGAPARRYLLQSDYARLQAMKWYRGESLSLSTQLRLGLGIAACAFRAP